MRLVTTLAAAILASSVATPLLAQGRGNGQAKKQPAATRAKVDAPRPGKNTVKADTRTARPAKADAKVAKAGVKAAKADARVAKKSPAPVPPTTTTSVTTTTPTTTRLKNPKLESRLQAMLPPGATVTDASAGFKNWGQFVAAVHVSNNLGIPFADLKAAMTGIPVGTLPGMPPPVTTTPMSLGQAIQSLKATSPEAGTLSTTRVNREVKKAEDSATADLRQTRERS